MLEILTDYRIGDLDYVKKNKMICPRPFKKDIEFFDASSSRHGNTRLQPAVNSSGSFAHRICGFPLLS